MTQDRVPDEQWAKLHKTDAEAWRALHPETDSLPDRSGLRSLQQRIGNRAVQRLLAQRSGDGPFDLDDETADRINRERGGGQSLDSTVQAKMGEATGHDFGDVNVHTSTESDTLNQQLGAKAFTTGQDIFFRNGAYDPASSGGQELIAHELTHVVQQSSGAVDNGSGMTVNAPGDVYEQEADAVSKAVVSNSPGAAVQRQAAEDEEEEVQMQPGEEEDEEVQMQADEEEEEEQRPLA